MTATDETTFLSWRVSEADWIDRLRRFRRWRHPLAAVLILASLGSMLPAYQSERFFRDAAMAAAASPDVMMHLATDPNVTDPRDRIEQHLTDAAEASYLLAYVSGFASGGLVASAIALLGTGISLLLPDRKTRILLRYHDRLAELDPDFNEPMAPPHR